MPGIPAIPSEQRNPFDEFDEKNPFDQFDGPQSNYVVDKARRLGRAIPEAIGQVIASPGSALQSAAQLGTDALLKVAEKRGDLAGPDLDAARARFERELSLRPEMQAAQALRDVGGQVGKAFPGIGPADPARDREVGSAVASGAASIVPILAAGPFGAAPAIATGAGMMGEQQRADAEQRGATPSQQAASFALGAGTGAVSEAALGVPALLRSVRGAKIVPQALAGAEAGVDKLVASQLGQLAPMLGKLAPAIVPIAQQAVKSAVREGLQEGLEQIAQNTIAKDVVAYDPTRDRTEGAGMAMLAGSIVGGGVGAFTQATQGLDTGKNVAETAATLKAQQEQLLAGRRLAQMFPVNAEGKVTNELPLPEGMKRTENERGVFHYNPQQITADEILSLSAKGEENKILALGSTSKPAATAAAITKKEPLVTITERTPDGTEVRSAVINQSDAEKTMAEMRTGLTPGNTLAVETPKQTLAGRNFVDEELDQGEKDAKARRDAEALELAARELRQRELDAKKVNVTQAMQQGAAVLADPAATYAAIDGALKRVAFYADNNAVGITADQRLGAQRQQAKLAQRLAALEPAEQARRDLENQKRLADDAAALAAKKAQRTEGNRGFKQEVQAGRDATGAVDYARLTEADLEARAIAGDKKAEREMIERGDRAGDDRPTLLDVLARVKLPASDPALAGELKQLFEGMTPEQRRKFVATKETTGLDSVAETFRADHGFTQIQTPADVIDFVERALRGEDIRPESAGQDQVEFATKARQPIVVWHAARGKKFDAFDMSKARDGAHFFATNPSHAAFFGDARPYVVQIDNPKTISQADLENRWDERVNDNGESGVLPRDMVKSFVEDAKDEGFDGLIIKDFADVDQESDVYLPFTPQQIKPADDEQLAGPPNKNSARPEPTSRPVRSREEIGTPRPASNSGPEFATIQDTFDLGGTPVGIDLPNEVRNLTPRWQDKALAFESSLDKALYYAGGTNSETRDLVASRLAQQTGLTTGQIATLARTLRSRLEPLTRSTAKASTVRVPAQMRTDVAKLTGAEFAQDTKPTPDATDDATIQREWTALVRAFPRLADLFKLRIGNIQSEFDQAGYRGQVPSNVEAAVWGQKRLIVIAARAWRDRNNGSALLTHEVAHLFWDTLPAEAQEQLRALHAQETAKKTGPLYDDQGFMRGSIQFERDRLPVSRVAADPDLPVKEWFAERIAMLNKAWAEGRLNRTESSLLQRLAFELRQLMRRVVEAFAASSNIDPDSELFESQFRAFIEAGADVRLGQAAGTAYAQRKAQFAQRPEFATGNRGLSWQRFQEWSAQFPTFAEWNDRVMNTPGRLIAGRPEKNRNYELRLVPVADIKPNQEGEDYLNDSSRETARKIKAGTAVESRAADLAPVLLEADGRSLLDGNHRHAAATLNGDREILALVPIGPGTGQVVNLRKFYDENVSGAPEFATGDDAPLDRLEAKQIETPPPPPDGTPLAQQWIKVMPAFQGGKYQMAETVAAAIAKTLTAEQRQKIDTVVDYFGGGGMWGGYLALTHFSNAKRLVVYELDPRRAEKIRLFHERGDQVAAMLQKTEVKAWLDRVVADAEAAPDVEDLLGETVAETDGTTSGTALAARIEASAPAEYQGLAGALGDTGRMNARGRQKNQEGEKTAIATMAKIIKVTIRDAEDTRRGALALRARGVTTEIRTGNSYQGEIVDGDRTLAVMDPPYYLTTGYDGKIVGLGIYEQTGDMLQRLAAAGNAVVYTDAAWHKDHPEQLKATGGLFNGGMPADQVNLGNIVDSLNAFSIVSLEDRHEILGINQPGHRAGALALSARNNLGESRSGRGGPQSGGTNRDAQPATRAVVAQDSPDRGGTTDQDPGDARPDYGRRLGEIESALAGLAESQEDQTEIEARGRALKIEREQILAEQRAAAREAAVARSIVDLRHPAAVATPEPGEAWAMVPKMTDAELRQEREKVGLHIIDHFKTASRAETALLHARVNAIRAEEKRREPAPRRDAQGNALVDEIPKVDRQAALIAELQRGRALATEGNRTGNDEALKEGTRLVRLATERLDDEFPGWETPARPTTAQAPSAAPDATDTQLGNTSPPPPPTPPETAEAAQPDDSEPSPFTGEAEPAEPIRPGKIAEVYGQSSYQPGVVVRAWRKVRDVLAGIRGPVPELPAFPASKWNAEDGFIRSKGATFYNGIRDFYRALKSGNDYVQRTAEEQVSRIARPLIEAGGRFRADDYAKLQARQEQARRLRAEGKTVPPGVLAEIRGLQSAMESNPYVLFNRLVLLLDLKWRHENLKDSAGNPIRLPSALNRTEITSEIKRLGATIAAGPHAELIRTALTQHKALVAQVAADLQARELMAAEQLANPYYFPHVTLEIERGGKVEQRELSPTRVRPGTEADFRGYLQTPVGSSKPIETDYVRALYFHLVQVGAHNLKADAIAQHARPYDIMAEVRERAKRLTKTRGQPVSWEQAFHEDYAPQGYVMYGTDSRDAFPTVLVDRDKLARRLGAELTSEDLHQQLERLGQTGVRLLADDLKETLMQGNRETWIVPARVAEALRGIADRETQGTSALDAALKRGLGAWKAWKLFMPWNHIRYEYGNVVADVEKIFSATPGTFKAMPEAAREIRAFWLGGEPNADLRAALKDGVINAITAQEMGGLTRLRAFNEFETTAQKVWNTLKARGSSALLQPITAPLGLGDFSSPELSAFREAVFRYANYKHNLAKIRAGERPDYGGAYNRDIEAMQDSKPGAGDRAQRQAAQISKSTFGDYGDLSVLGQGVRDKLIPFYSWMEVNFKYHANLLRNLRDMVRAGEASKAEAAGKGARAAATFAAGFGARAAGRFALRLALPYVAVALWNATGDRDELEEELSEEDRRRFHIILGRTADGKVNVVYGQTALIDVMKWFSGARFAQQAGAYLNGKTDFTTALGEWRDNLVPDFLNNTAGSFGPYAKIPLTLATKKNPFPDVTDMRSIPAYDMKRVVLGQIADDFTADMLMRVVDKDYYSGRDFGTWAKQLVLQIRQRDPEAYAFYEIKDKAADFLAKQTGAKRESSYDAPDQQVLRNFRRAIFKGDVDMAAQAYQRLLDYGYTAERFKQSIRAQEPLAGLPKDQRRAFLDSLTPDGRDQLARAERYYVRLNSQRGQERGLFPSERSGAAGLERYRQNPQIERLRQSMENVGRLEEDALQLQADRALRESLKKSR